MPQPSQEECSRAALAVGCAGAVAWTAGMLRKGLVQVFAVQLAECFESKHHAPLMERLRQDSADSAMAGELEAALAAWVQAGPAERAMLVERLGPIIFAGVDRVLEQAQAAGRDRTGMHLAAARFGYDLVILADPDPQQAWLLPTTQARLREAFAELGFYPTAAETQELDLEQGDVLQLLGVEFRGVRDRHGTWRVEYLRAATRSTAWDPVAEPGGADPPLAPQSANAAAPKRPEGSAVLGKDRPAPKQPEPEEQPAATANPQAGWVLGGVLRWRPFGNSPHHDVTRLADPGRLVPHSWRQAAALEVGWRHLPITLYPVLGLLAGWNSLPAWLCLALAALGNWHSLLLWRHLPAVAALARRRWLDLALFLCGMATLSILLYALIDICANLSGEVPAPSMPPGFSIGQFNPDSPWGTELMEYILYVPPHLKNEEGPFPLIVFLHGYGKRKRDEVLGLGVPYAITNHFGERNPYGRFEFIAFCPIDPSGVWETGSPGVENNMKALDYVMRRHRIDPQRVYLTGISTGGNGVWRLAEAYPDKWAAIAPFAALIVPGDLRKVRQFPTWIFHGAKDKLVPVEQARTLVRQLKEAKADVRYTELPDFDHHLKSAYYSRELYDWFARQRKKD